VRAPPAWSSSATDSGATATDSDPGILQRAITLDGQPYQVVGVMPPEFRLWAADLWSRSGCLGNSRRAVRCATGCRSTAGLLPGRRNSQPRLAWT
jgi:hypothetical protein